VRHKKSAVLLSSWLSELENGIVIVEGMHDIKALGKFGIKAATYSFAMANAKSIVEDSLLANKKIFLLFDTDNGGLDKQNRLQTLLESISPYCRIDAGLSSRLLKLLNARSIEQIAKPVAELLNKGEEYGENILRYSKVYDNSEFQH